jgi:uncharacterized protein with HEPN domain
LTSREQQSLLDILIAAEHATTLVAGRPASVLHDEIAVRAAVLHFLTVIGEAATRILKLEEPASLPDLPWRKMADLRNVIVHEYDGINVERIWLVLDRELPLVIAAILPLFPERMQPPG